jgi:crotonobetainyl-CoA:carnitine CoA-transferase CaiB-like acyl-CoA transferase
VVTGSAPLAGVRVVDLSRFVSGAYAGTLLAALGAEVLKIEVPPHGDPYRSQGTAFVGRESALFQALNVGKRSVQLDIKDPQDREALERLIASADVLLENGRPGSLARA